MLGDISRPGFGGPSYPWGYSINGGSYTVPGAAGTSGGSAQSTVGAGVCAVLGCTDSLACNYDAAANTDDGSCTYASAGYDCLGNCLTTALTITTEVCNSATEARMTGPWWNWDPAGGPVAVDNGNGTWTFTFCPT